MKQATINHKRITAIVRQEAETVIRRVREYNEEQREHPDSELAAALKKRIIPGIEFEYSGAVPKVFVTINDDFLSLVGYDANLEGFIADYFGSDYKLMDGKPLRFRFIDGFLINKMRDE